MNWKITTFIVACLAIFVSGFFAPRIPMVGVDIGDSLDDMIMTDEEKIEALPEELRLKVPVEKILDDEVIKDIRCDVKNPNNCVDLGDIVKYEYVHEEEFAPTMIEKKIYEKNVTLTEDITKRTSNSLHYKIKEENN